jgi:hypothetical protein
MELQLYDPENCEKKSLKSQRILKISTSIEYRENKICYLVHVFYWYEQRILYDMSLVKAHRKLYKFIEKLVNVKQIILLLPQKYAC